MVKDIYPGNAPGYSGYWGYYPGGPYSSSPSSLTNVNGTLYFTATDATHGTQLWKSDGTAAGTVLVKDFSPGWSGGVESLANVNGTLYIAASDGTNGGELWKSDGTVAGTVLVKDIVPGSGGSVPYYLTNVNGTLYFSADDGAHGRELWKSDGTAAGTVLAADVHPGAAGSTPRWLTDVNGTLYFSADDGMHGRELWASEGTAAALVGDIYAGAASSYPSFLTAVSGTLFFRANDVIHGDELWKVAPDSNGQPAISITDATVTEGNAGTTAVQFTVSLSAPSEVPVTVNYATTGGTAISGTDFQSASGTLTFAPGEVTQPVTVLVTGDRLAEPDETFFLELTGPTNAVIIDNRGVGTILDDEPRVSIGDVTVTEGNTGTVAAVFTVTLAAAYDQPVTVPYTTANGTATAGTDFLSATNSVTLPAGATSHTVAVSVVADRLGEPDETFVVNLTGTAGTTVADGQGVGTIRDDEPRISIGDVSRFEGRKGQTTVLTFIVRLSAAYDKAVTFSYRTRDGTATTANNDYRAKSGTITFTPGETAKTITIEVKGDSRREADETFYVDLFGNTSNSLLLDGVGIGAILNDD
jgi:ELWxxDGT repeat protein